jgi:hypothetical protein
LDRHKRATLTFPAPFQVRLVPKSETLLEGRVLMQRRKFIIKSGVLVAGAAVLQSTGFASAEAQTAKLVRITPGQPIDAATLHALVGRTPISQPPLPYAEAALAPTLSEQTMNRRGTRPQRCARR